MKRLHLICNAHIDPIWQWGWDEGLSAAIATFKSAADLADVQFDYPSKFFKWKSKDGSEIAVTYSESYN